MKKITKFWKCDECHAVLEEVSDCKKGPVCVPHCCGKPMTEITEKHEDVSVEKHVPVLEKLSAGVKVSVGAVPHPMTKEHFIEWIEIVTPDGRVCRKYLTADDSPEAFFCSMPVKGALMREYCSVHGLWSAEITQ